MPSYPWYCLYCATLTTELFLRQRRWRWCLSTGKPGESSCPPSSRKTSAKIIYSFWHHKSILAQQQCPCCSLTAALGKLHRYALLSACLALPYSFKEMGREGSCWLFWGKDRWGCHTHAGTVRLHSWSQWTSPVSGAPLKSLEKRGRDFFGCWVKCHMKGGNRSIKCSILSLSVPKGANRGLWLEQAYLVPLLQFPSFQALSKAGVLSAWIILPFSIPNMFVQTDRYIYLCVHTYQLGISAQPSYWMKW